MQFQVFHAQCLDTLDEQIQPAQWRRYASLLVQVFVSTSPALLLQVSRLLRKRLPHSQIVGATASESIVQAHSTTAPIVVTITAFSHTRLVPVALPDLKEPALAETAARRFSEQLRKTPDCRLTIMFWEGENAQVEPFLGQLRPLPEQSIVGGLASPARNGGTAILLNEQLFQHGMVAVSLHNPRLHVFSGYHFGWEPVSVAHLVTRAEGRRVYEINYRPAIDLYRHYLDENAALESGLSFPLLLEHHSRLIARTPMQVHEDGSIEFAGRIETGQLVRLSFGDRRRMLKAQYEQGLPNAEVLFIYSCIGRRLFLEKLADQTMEIFTRLPNGGFYTHGEIVTEQGRVQLYNETMTFVALAERPMPALPNPHPPAHLMKPSTVDRFISLLHRAQEDTQQLETLLNNNAMAFVTLVRREDRWLPIRASAGIRMLGLNAATLLQSQQNFLDRLPRQDQARLLELAQSSHAWQMLTQLRHEKGHTLPVMLRMVRPASHHGGKLDTLYLLIEDLTPQEHLKRIFAMFEQGPVVLFEWSGMMEKLQYVSSNAATLLNLDLQALQNETLTLEDAIVEDDRPDLIAAIERAQARRQADFQHTFRLQDRTGQLHWVSSHLHAVFGPDGEMSWLYGFLLDITAEKQALQALQAEKNRIAELAARDTLTGLYNRHYLEQHLRQLPPVREETCHALFFIDLDHFKEANDLYGHAAGDEVLIQFSQRLCQCFSPHQATLARFGGDEFVVLVESLATEQTEAHRQAETLARSILQAANRPFPWQDTTLHISASIGILLFDQGEADTLLRYSDMSMYLAKREGRGRWHFFSKAEQQAQEARTARLQALRHAVNRNELQLAFQPQLRWQDGRLTLAGAETLLRWRHPRWGTIAPGEFLPLAEENGLMPQLEEWVMDRALRQFAFWQQRYPALFDANFHLSINISEARFRQRDFTDTLTHLCHHYQIVPDRICLELTEGMVHADLNYTLNTLHRLREAGFHLALDDFGTGYSSLSHLKDLPIDTLKIDRSFIQSMLKRPEDEILTRTILQLAHNFKLNVVAEGIEDADTLRQLIRMGCQGFQGFYIARPLSAEKLLSWLQQFQQRMERADASPTTPHYKEPPSHALH